MKFRFTRPCSKQIVAALLAFWMSGAMSVLCCGAAHPQAKSEHCPLRKNHCEKTKAEKSAAFFTTTEAIDGCRFPSAVFDKARKLQTNPQAAHSPEKITVGATRFFAVVKFQPSRIAYRALVLDRGGTY